MVCQTGLWLVCVCVILTVEGIVVLMCCAYACCACGCNICVNCAWQAGMTVGASWISMCMSILLFTVSCVWYWVEFEAGHQLLAYYTIWILWHCVS